ncbi:MAG: hypothetical protein ACP5RT_01510 [Candidatus Micrarchaeia archaeon]
MDAQISLEVLFYLSLSSLAMLLMASLAVRYIPYINNKLNEYAAFLLISKINELTAYRKSLNFYFYTPKGLCNSSISNDSVESSLGSFYLSPTVKVKNRVFCPDGTYANFSLENKQGYVILGRIYESTN